MILPEAPMLPTLETRRLRLRWLDTADLPALFAIFSDPEVMRYWSHEPLTDLAAAGELLAEIQGYFTRRELFQWGIVRREDNLVIGTCTLAQIASCHRRAEVGFALGRRSWGQGFASEALTELLRFAFEELDLNRLEADVDPRNEASLRTLERLGFRREGFLCERYFVGGELQDSVLLGLLRRDWEAARSGPQGLVGAAGNTAPGRRR